MKRETLYRDDGRLVELETPDTGEPIDVTLDGARPAWLIINRRKVAFFADDAFARQIGALLVAHEAQAELHSAGHELMSALLNVATTPFETFDKAFKRFGKTLQLNCAVLADPNLPIIRLTPVAPTHH